MNEIRVITAAGNIDREAATAQELSRMSGIELVLRCLERAEFLAAVRGGRIDVAVIVGAPPWLDRFVLSECDEHSTRAIGIAIDPLEAESLRGMQVELALPDASLEEVLRPSAPDPVVQLPIEAPTGRLVAVWGPKGSPGRSTVAAELAAQISKTEPRTILIDADTYGGDLAQMFAVVEEMPTIVWAAQAAGEDRLDEDTIANVLRRTSAAGPVLLPGINRAELWTDISKFGWSRLIEFMTRTFAYSIVDVGFGVEFDDRAQQDRDRLARQTISLASHVVAVCKGDPVGIKSFLWAIERLKEIREMEDILVVVNKVLPGEVDEIKYLLRRHLGKRPIAFLPFRPNDARRALDRGIPIGAVRPNGDVNSAIRDLAGAIGAAVPARGLLVRLGGRSA